MSSADVEASLSHTNDDNTNETNSTDLNKTDDTNSQQNSDANNDSNNNMSDLVYDTSGADDNNTTVVENTNNGNNPNYNDDDDYPDEEDGDDNDVVDNDNGRDNRNGKSNDDHQNENEKTNLIVNYLPQDLKDEQFEDLFKKFGPMKSCKIVRHRLTGSSYGFGFVDYETNEQALKAIDELNGYELETKKIKVAFARPPGQDIKQANLYIKNVPNSWTQEDVSKIFEPYGKIIQVRVLGNDRGIAFVLYDLRKQAEDALEALNGKQVDGCERPLEIKFAADKKSDKGGKSDSNSNNNNRRDRGHNRGSRNRNNNNNNGRDSNRMGSMDRRNKQMDGGRGRSRNNNNQSQYNNNNSNNNNNNSFGPVRQQSSNRMARYAPFVPVQAQPAQMAPMAMAPTAAYGYPGGQQAPQMIPYMMGYQPAMAPMGQPMASMTNPRDAYQAPMPMAGYQPMAPTAMAPQQAQPTPLGSMYGMAPQTMQQTGFQMHHQPTTTNTSTTTSTNFTSSNQLGQQMGSMRGGHSNAGQMSSSSSSSGNSDGGVTLFVYNIGPDSDESELRSMFAPYGSVTKCNVVRKTPGGETKGFGFVTLQTRDQANAAISSLNGSMRNNRVLQVSFKK